MSLMVKRGLLTALLVLAVSITQAQDAVATSIREVARLPLVIGIGGKGISAHLLPDDNTIIHTNGSQFCAYALDGEQNWCVEIVEGNGADAVPVRPDPESITVAPDGRSLAFASYSVSTAHDSDIWLLDLETQEYRGLTADGYSGVLDDATLPEGVSQDRAPTWHPDGTLTFARQQPPFDGLPALWAAAPDGSAPEKLGDLAGVPVRRSTVLSMDWSDDGSWLVYILEGEPAVPGGLWLYDAVEGESRLLFTPSEAPLRADFSPDGMSVLLLTLARDTMRTPEEADLTGYYMVDVQTADAVALRWAGLVWAAGWLPDGRVLFIGEAPAPDESGGLFASASGQDATRLADLPHEGDRPLVVQVPTPGSRRSIEVSANGRFLLGGGGLLVMEVAGE